VLREATTINADVQRLSAAVGAACGWFCVGCAAAGESVVVEGFEACLSSRWRPGAWG